MEESLKIGCLSHAVEKQPFILLENNGLGIKLMMMNKY